jgi:IS1 family transposase
MQLSDHSLRQFDEAYLKSLGEDGLRALLAKALEDLKEARERLNRNSQNSSRPPGSEAPWEKPEKPENPYPDAVDGENEPPEGEWRREEPTRLEKEVDGAPPASLPVNAAKRAGKPVGARGYGRSAPERIDAEEVHAPACCAGCGASLQEAPKTAYTGAYEVDFVQGGGGWQVVWRKHLWQEAVCGGCGHATRAEPRRWEEDGVGMGGFRLIGPGLTTLIVALAKRYRLGRRRIREFLGDWLGVWLSVGSIQGAIDEAGAVVAPVERELIEAVRQSGLLHADETPWPEQGAKQTSLWLWVFTAATVTFYCISHRGQELVRNLLEDYAGVLMSDGWQAYRWLSRRLRCWAHLKRKAVGLSESFSPEARRFGRETLALWSALREAVLKAREGPPGSIQGDFEARLSAFQARCEALRGSSHEKTRELAREFLNDWAAIFAVLDDPRWPLTNNEAERALRHWVILRRLRHGTRTERGSKNLALLASVIDTCRQRGHSPWGYLETAIVCRRQGMNLPALPV